MTQTTTISRQSSIDIGAIEKELAALWKQPADAQNNIDSSPHITRACVMTLVVPVSGQRAANDASTVITQLTDRFPNRAIVVDMRASTDDDMIDAWVQANCQIPSTGHSQICGEQITIEASGAALARVPGTLLPLLVADVPVVLWWAQGAPTGAALFPRLAALADRIIVDSATFDVPEQQLTEQIQFAHAKHTVSDLAWGRLTPWRELTAQFFDSPNMVGHLAEIEQVSVRYHAPPDGTLDRVQPLLFVGWLAAKLGWTVETPTPATAAASFTLHRADGGQVVVAFAPAAASEPTSSVIEDLAIHCAHADFQIACGSADENCAEATAQIKGFTPVRRMVRLERHERADLLAEELRLFGHDKGYEGALEAAMAMVGVTE